MRIAVPKLLSTEALRTWTVVGVFAVAMILCAIAAAIVAEAEPGLTAIVGYGFSGVALVLAVNGFAPFKEPGEQYISLVRRLLHRLAATWPRAVCFILAMSFLTGIAWIFGPSRVLTPVIKCSSAVSIRLKDWMGGWRVESCADTTERIPKIWQPRGQAFVLRTSACVYAHAGERTLLWSPTTLSCPDVPAPAPESPTLEAVAVNLTKEGVLDLALRNLDTQLSAVITRLRAKIVKDHDISVRPVLLPSAHYVLDIGEAAEGAILQIDNFKHQVPAGEADRFTVLFRTNRVLTLHVVLEYNGTGRLDLGEQQLTFDQLPGRHATLSGAR